MSGLTIDFEKRDGWFNFHFVMNTLTADFCIEEPYTRSKEEWKLMRDAIKDRHNSQLIFGTDDSVYIETNGNGSISFCSGIHFYSGVGKGLGVNIGVNLHLDKDVVLEIFNHILENHF